MHDQNAELVNCWINFTLDEESQPEKNPNFWAHEELDRLSEEEPKMCFDIIARISEKSNEDLVLANLAAGPLEDLLVRNGSVIISEIEKWVMQETKNKKILAFVWRNNIEEGVWQKIIELTKDVRRF